MGGRESTSFASAGCHSLKLYKNVSLQNHSTMRVGGFASLFATAHTIADVECAFAWAYENRVRVCIIGNGSNTFWTDAGYAGLVLKNKILGFRTTTEDKDSVTVHIGAGEVLDEVVERTTQLGLTGMECLSLVPGTVEGAIIHNPGAYGQEISHTLVSVEVYDTTEREIATLAAEACQLSYRSSLFKEKPGRCVILGLTAKLRRGVAERPSHPALLALLEGGRFRSSTEVREAVIGIRNAKLPDPASIRNCGSFFANPIISEKQMNLLAKGSGALRQMTKLGWYKIPAAWLIEQNGLKDHTWAESGLGTW